MMTIHKDMEHKINESISFTSSFGQFQAAVFLWKANEKSMLRESILGSILRPIMYHYTPNLL